MTNKLTNKLAWQKFSWRIEQLLPNFQGAPSNQNELFRGPKVAPRFIFGQQLRFKDQKGKLERLVAADVYRGMYYRFSTHYEYELHFLNTTSLCHYMLADLFGDELLSAHWSNTLSHSFNLQFLSGKRQRGWGTLVAQSLAWKYTTVTSHLGPKSWATSF